MKSTRIALVSVALSSLFAASQTRAAAWYIGEFGAKSTARGGANVVDPEDPSAAWLNPAAITLATGPQLQLDLNLVWLHSSYIRDCGGKKDGCGPGDDVKKSYADGKHKYSVTDARPATDDEFVFAPDVNSLGRGAEVNGASEFDGKKATENQAGVQPIPRGYFSFNLDTFGLDGFAAGAFVTAPNAGDYKFGEDAPTRYSLIDRDLFEVFYGVVLGYRFDNWIAVGAALEGVSSGLDQTIALSADQYGNEDPGYDIVARITAQQHFIPSANFGLWSNPLKPLGIGDLELGVSVQLPRVVTATGPITIVSKGEKFKTEYEEGLGVKLEEKDATATASFVLPPMYRAGIKYGMDDVLHDGSKLFGFDVELATVIEQWSTYDHVFLKTKGLTVDFSPTDGEPGKELDPITQPKDWQNSFSVRLGGSAKFLDEMVMVHGGGFYESSAIPNETYDVQLVCGDKIGLGTGVTGKLFGVALTVAYSHIFVADRTVGDESIVYLGNSGDSILADGETRTRIAMGKYSASYDMVEFALNVAFDEMFGFGVHARPTTSDAPIVPDVPVTPAAPTAPDVPAPAPAPAPDVPAPDAPAPAPAEPPPAPPQSA